MRSQVTRHRRMGNQAAGKLQPSVMVIDDDSNITTSIAALLTTAGYSAIKCHTSDEAIQAVRQSVPDMVIADVNLAGHSGLDLCHQLRLETGMSDVPWMYLSGAQTPDIIRRTDENGGVYYLRKPFDCKVLLALVRKAMWLPEEAAACPVSLATGAV